RDRSSNMAIEPKRGCGYRKVGGTYLMGGRLGAPCCKLPFALDVCPTCASGVKQTRGWTWIDPRPWLKGECRYQPADAFADASNPLHCAAADPARLGDPVGLLWIGTQFYPTPGHFSTEAASLGISRRLTAVPRNFLPGRDWVFLAHPKTMIGGEPKPGVFALFKPTHIEKIVTQSQSEDVAAMEVLRKRGITPVIVPDDDKDHQGSIYDDDDIAEDAPLPMGAGATP